MFRNVINVGLLKQYIAGLAACQSVFVSGVAFGWIVPILGDLSGPASPVPMTEEEAGWVAAVMESGSWFSPLLAGALSSRLGRKPVILASAPMFVAAWLMILYLRTPLWMAIARYIQGFAIGFVFTVTPVYLGEIASASARGFVTGAFFVFWWLGIVAAYAAGPCLPFAAYTWCALAVNVPFAAAFALQPETPHYLLLLSPGGDRPAAGRALRRLRAAAADDVLDRELDEIAAAAADVPADRSRYAGLFRSAGARRALALLMVANALRILSGTGVTLVFTTEIFRLTADATPVPPARATVALGLVMLAGGLAGSLLSDLLGRRRLVLISSAGCFLCQLAAGAYYYLRFETAAPVASYGWTAPLAILVYSALVSGGLYPVCASYASELFPAELRGPASGLSAVNIVLMTFLTMVAYTPVKLAVGVYANFCAYAAFSLLGTAYLYARAVETRGKSFAQISRELDDAAAGRR